MRTSYEPLEPLARNKINPKRIETHWPDTLRVAGSLITNQIPAYDLLRMLGREGHPTPLGAAFAECGRIDKTLCLLAWVDPIDDTYRRSMNRQLTVQESRHRLARAIAHGGNGQIRQAYRDGQEDQLAALGLVLNAVVLWIHPLPGRRRHRAARRRRGGGRGGCEAPVPAAEQPHQLPRPPRLRSRLPSQGLRPLRDRTAPDDTDSDAEDEQSAPGCRANDPGDGPSAPDHWRTQDVHPARPRRSAAAIRTFGFSSRRSSRAADP